MDITYDKHPEAMTTEQLTASLRVLATCKKTLESELLKRLLSGEEVKGYTLGLRKDYK